MGCQVGKTSTSVSESSSSGKTICLQVLTQRDSLLDLFANFNNVVSNSDNLKVIFVFGGSGSRKGELIWKLLQNNNNNSVKNEVVFRYLDVESLIVCNIKRRVEELAEEGHHFNSDLLDLQLELMVQSSSNTGDSTSLLLNTHEQQDSIDLEVLSSPRRGINAKQVRQYLTDFANVVTFSWILTLIQEEMHFVISLLERTSASSKKEEKGDKKNKVINVFLVNLLPNRVNIFKKCLYLNQTPNFYHVPFDFFAINLVRDSTSFSSKDVLDSMTKVNVNLSNIYDEANSMFVNFFRSIKRIIDVDVSESEAQEPVIRLKVSFNEKDGSATRVSDWKQVKNILLSNNNNNKIITTINPSSLLLKSFSPRSSITNNKSTINGNTSMSGIFFVVDKKIELEKVVLELDDSCFKEDNMVAVKRLVMMVKEAKTAIEEEKAWSRRSSSCNGIRSRSFSRRGSTVSSEVQSTMTTTPVIVVSPLKRSSGSFCEEEPQM